MPRIESLDKCQAVLTPTIATFFRIVAIVYVYLAVRLVSSDLVSPASRSLIDITHRWN